MNYETKTKEVTLLKNDFIIVKVERPDNYKFISGQHAMIKLNNEQRPFTIASANDDEDIEFLIKSHGKFTKQLENLKEGDEIIISEAFGEKFNFTKDSKEDLVMVAGGSGITPFMSVLRFIKNNNLPNKVDLFFYNQTTIPYEEELKNLNELENINVHFSLTRPKEGWKGMVGYLTNDSIKDINCNERTWFLCGPTNLLETTIKILENKGVNKANIKYEGWALSSKEKKKMEKNKLYKCEICGNVAQMVEGKPIPLMCCGQEMQEMPEKTEEEGNEKHKPVVEINGNEVTVKVGSVAHPMEEAHYIEMIQLFQGNKIVAMKQLLPGEKPEAKFVLENTEGLTAKAFCNIHGFWRN
ncbi:hypothetical protein KY334_08170 [Candidatus Woesearchaeota archaeon]|nr:hypothetical protein [Candidatus Woesearchaeota archaeon]